MLFGESGNNGPYVQYMDLVKTDANGNVLWNNTFGLNGLINFGISAKQTFDHGYILCGSYGNLGSDTLALVKTDASGNETWHYTYSAHNNRDVGQSVLQTNDSGFVAVGFEGNANPSVYLVKTNVAGNLQWSNSFPQVGYEVGECIKQVGNNGYVVCGRTNSKGHGQDDIYLMRINSAGDSLWTKTFGTDSAERGHAVDVTNDGGFIIVGEDYFPGGDIWLIKTDSSGVQQWVRKFGGVGWDFGHDVKQCRDGGYIIAGRKEVNLNDNQFYCFKTDSAGILEWDHVFPGAGALSEAYSVYQNNDGGFIFLGYTLNATNDSSDFYYIRLDSTGALSVPSIDSNALNSVSVFPNPASGMIYMYLQTQSPGRITATISDVLGKILFRKQESYVTNELYESFDLSEFQSGVYFLQLNFNDQVVLKKIIKE